MDVSGRRKSTGLRATLLWIKMGGSLWPSSGGSVVQVKILCRAPVDVLCSQVQRGIKGNIKVDYKDGFTLA